MKTTLSRIDNFTNLLTWYSGLLFLILHLLTKSSIPDDIQAQTEVVDIIRRDDVNFIKIKPGIDLSRIFKKWYVKQVFLYCTLTKDETTEIIWSAIVTRDEKNFEFSDTVVNNYRIHCKDLHNFTLRLEGEVLPFVGRFTNLIFKTIEVN